MIRCQFCGKPFGGERGYRDHRRYDTCKTPAQLLRLGYKLNAAGWWVRPDPKGEKQLRLAGTAVGRPRHSLRVAGRPKGVAST